jgi:hypothetical protein
MKLKLSMAKI